MKLLAQPEASNRGWKVSDIRGFEVFDVKGRKLGILCGVISTAGNDVWVVKDAGKEILIPALKSVVREVDTVKRKILAQLPEGCEAVSEPSKNSEDIEYDGYRVYED